MKILGDLLNICYEIVHNYGAAILLFTLFTKIILFPLSVWVQKNSVKIVRITPEMNQIKATYFGDKDIIAEKTAELYKREKYNPFASTIPMLIQIVLLMGLVEVISNPTVYLQQTASGISDDIISLGRVPVVVGGWTLLMPVAAAIAAWILCIGQNKLNPLQAEQGKWNQIGVTVISVGISLILGAYVPLGVGFYWVWSNLFSLVQQVLLNKVINPKKYIDYDELEKSKQKLAGLEQVGKRKNYGAKKKEYVKREKADYKRFFSVANKHLVIYSEGSGYYKYFKNIIAYLLEHSNIVIHYITNDPTDIIFEKADENPRIKAYYIGEKRAITLMMKMDAEIVLMTTPDLDNYYLKRSYVKKDVEYIYTNHGIGSDNVMLKTHALDHFDTIFCVGPHLAAEARAAEKLYGLPAKNLVETGYCLTDDMDECYAKMEKKENEVKTILIAPSWQNDNILDLCLDEIIAGIADRGYKVIVRPHPQYVKIHSEKVAQIIERYRDRLNENFVIETDFSSNETVYGADLVISDWSSIGFEFCFTTYKPTLFINTPMKVLNPEWDKLGVEPFDLYMRPKVGAALEPEQLSDIGNIVDDLIQNTAFYREKIAELKQQSFYSLGHSAEVSGQYILNRLKEKQDKTKNSQRV